MGDDWDWWLTDGSRDDLQSVGQEQRVRILGKLDQIADSAWRDPDEYVEPLADAAHGKLRIGEFRLGCRVDHEERILWILRISRRDGAYSADD